MKKFAWLPLLLFLLLPACGKDKKSPAQPADPSVMKPETADGDMKAGEPAPEKISCETLFARHGKCIFRISETSKVYNIPVGDSPKKGAAEPLATLIEFSEFQCPACKGFGLQAIPELLKKYEGKLQVVYKHFPLEFHEYALLAAIVSEEVRAQKGDEAFWKFHDLIYTGQDKLGPEFLNETAKGLGVDMEKLQKVILDEKSAHKQRVEAEYALGEKVDVQGTPFLYVNGIQWNPENQELGDLIDEQIARAEAAVAAGTPRAKVYGFLVDHGELVFEKPVPREELDRQLKAREKMFLTKCKTKDPEMAMLVNLLTACSKPDIACEAFTTCVENQVRQLPDAE